MKEDEVRIVARDSAQGAYALYGALDFIALFFQ
jgi:hypothetical protein